MPLTLTLDSNVVEDSNLLEAAREAGAEVAVVTVTERELGSSSYGVHILPLARIAEPGVWGEGTWGSGTWGGGDAVCFLDSDGSSVTAHPLEAILSVISNGSFPPQGQRDSLSRKQRNQLRDAMILCAHLQHRRSLFVTGDLKAFVSHGRREMFEQRFSCRIMTAAEAADWLRTNGAA